MTVPGSEVLEASGQVLVAWLGAGWRAVDLDRLVRTAMRAGLRRGSSLDAIELLEDAGLLRMDNGLLQPTGLALDIGTGLLRGKWDALGRALLAASSLRSQTMRLLELAVARSDGLYVDVSSGQRVAPQATYLLSWTASADDLWLELPVELHEAAILQEGPPSLPAWVEDQARVGRRAETYSLFRERLEHPGQVLHIAAERDDAGYDIEVTGPDWIRCVEVKGSRSTTLAFHLSLRELDEAKRRGPDYELQFWGGIDLSKAMADEYGELVSAGYPRCLGDLKAQIERGFLHLSPDGFLAKEAAEAADPN